MTFPHLVTVSLPSQTQFTLRFNVPKHSGPTGSSLHTSTLLQKLSRFIWIKLDYARLTWKQESALTIQSRRNQSDRLVSRQPRHNPPPPESQPENGSEVNGKLLCQLSTLRGQLLVSGRTGRCNKRKEQSGRAKPPFPNMVHSCQGPRTLPLPSPSLPSSRLSVCPPCSSHFQPPLGLTTPTL